MAYPEIMNIAEAASFLQIHPDGIYKMAQSGEIPAMKLRGKWRFSRVLLEEFIRKQSLENVSQEPEPNGKPLKKAVGTSSLYTIK